MQEGLPIITTLYCLPGENASASKGPYSKVSFPRQLQYLLPLANFSSTCYFFDSAVPQKNFILKKSLQRISSFLESNTFLQISFRPVHPFSPTESRSWISAYQHFLQVCRPFQVEAYREQIVSRLRIFPVIFFSSAEEVEAGLPFLDYLKKNFFLPSVIFPKSKARLIAGLNASEIGRRWERIYFTEADSFSPPMLQETLIAHQIFDGLLGDESNAFFEDGGFCQGNLILDDQGMIRACRTEPGRLLLDSPESTDSLKRPCFKGQLFSSSREYVNCTACLLPHMDHGGHCFRMNQQSRAWAEICDRLGGRLLKERHYNYALKVWEAATEGLEDLHIPLSIRLKKALCHYEKSDLDAAMAELEIARQAAPDRAEILYYMGLCEFGWRDYIEAADRFHEALELGLDTPMKREAEYFRGLSHYHLEEFNQALPPLEKARQAGREDSTLFFYQGLCRLGLKDYPGALSDLQEALDRGPVHDDLFHVLFYIAYTYKEMEVYQKAVEFCEKAREKNPHNKDIYNLKGFCHYKLGEYESAIACFEKALEIDPKSAIDYANIGSNLRELGKLDEALAMYKKALALDPAIDFARDNVKVIEKKLKRE